MIKKTDNNISIKFQDNIINIPSAMNHDAQTLPQLMVQVGSGKKHLTYSTLSGYESYCSVYHMEYEIFRCAEYDQGSQIYGAKIPSISEIIFVLQADTLQADIFNLLINAVPIDLIEFVKLDTKGSNLITRESISFLNCIITKAKAYTTCWDDQNNNNLLLVAFQATQWSTRINGVDQANKPVGTGAADYRFEYNL